MRRAASRGLIEFSVGPLMISVLAATCAAGCKAPLKDRVAKEGWKTAATEFDGMLGKHKGESVAEAVPKLTEWLKAQSLEFPIELDANGKRVLPNAPASVGDCEVYADAVLGPQPRCYFNARLAADSVGWPRLACLDASGAVLDTTFLRLDVPSTAKAGDTARFTVANIYECWMKSGAKIRIAVGSEASGE